MRKILCLFVISMSIFLLSCCGWFKEDLPDLGIDWKSVQQNISNEKLAEFGWFAGDLGEEIEEFGTVTFCNYNPDSFEAFKEVAYQFTIEYGCGYEYVNGKVEYYEIPVYSIMLVDNGSDLYYSCTYDESFLLLSEEGEWFLSEDKAEYVTMCLRNCESVIKGN